MWDEEINKKIKDAADQYHPAYDDTAWDKMEQMLDDHLPKKKDRRRIIYFIPLVLLLGGGLFFVFSHKEAIHAPQISAKTVLKSNVEKSQDKSAGFSSPIAIANPNAKSTGNQARYVKRRNVSLKDPSINTANSGTKKIEKLPLPGTADIAENNDTKKLASENLSSGRVKQAGNKPVSIQVNAGNSSRTEDSAGEAEAKITSPQGDDTVPAPMEGDNNPLKKTNTVITKNEAGILKSKDKDVAKAENAKDEKNIKSNVKQNKTKRSFARNFGIGLSAGPDVSAVKLSNTGKITFSYGAEVHYSFTNRFTLRTGFYVAKKIYSVDEDEYYVRPGSTWNNFLESINANCKVYEIPVTLSYSFGKTKNHNWFASAGLSSYFMKKESYVYYYKNPIGITYNRPWTVTNQNKHYFSVLDISAGYQYAIDKRFSIMAEPYVKVPLSGIGIGKIKLNSAGILFTAAVKPF